MMELVIENMSKDMVMKSKVRKQMKALFKNENDGTPTYDVILNIENGISMDTLNICGVEVLYIRFYNSKHTEENAITLRNGDFSKITIQ